MKKNFIKQVRIIINTIVNVTMDATKTIKEEEVLIHQTMREQAKGMEDGTTKDKMKGKCMINLKFNFIIIKNMVIMLMI